jgi:hypothetical protein
MHQPLSNKYDTLILPVDYNKSFLDFSGEEIQKYYQWFLSIKDARLAHLCSFLFSENKNCLNEKNLNVIETFLLNCVSTVPKPKEQFKAETEKIPTHLKPYATPDSYLLDKRTISICYDIGIFLGDLIISLDNKIKWELEIDDEYADYGQPILAKKNIKLKLNPFRIVKNIAATIYEDRYSENELINVFNTWKRLYKVVW